MSAAPKIYPAPIQPQRWCRNGLVPDAAYLRQLVRAQNHIMAYRRKVFCRWGDVNNATAGAAGTVNRYRFRCHVGYGTTHIGFVFGMGRAGTTGANPNVVISATVAGGATSTKTFYQGLENTISTDGPNSITWIRTKIAVTANTTYEMLVSSVDYARILSVMAYEVAATEVDSAVDYFHELAPGVGQPIHDSIRERIFTGLTALYKRNGPHLYSFLGNGDGTNPSFTGTTWTNIIDGTTTTTSEAAGVYVSDVANSGPSHAYRLSDGAATGFSAVLAVYGQVTTASNGGEVRFYDDSIGTIATITGITTTLQWHTTTVTINDLATLGKMVVQARHNTAAHTVRVDAVSLYAYET